MNWLSSSGRSVSFGGFSGERGASERARRLVRTAFWFCGQCNTQVDLLSDGRSSDVASNPVFKMFASKGIILVRKKKKNLLPLFERKDVALRK